MMNPLPALATTSTQHPAPPPHHHPGRSVVAASAPSHANQLIQRYGRPATLERRLEKLTRQQRPVARSVSGQEEAFRMMPDVARVQQEHFNHAAAPPTRSDSARTRDSSSPSALRLREVFRRVVSRIQVISGLKSRVESPFASGIRKDSASVATLHITITRPEPAVDATAKDPMQLWFFRFRNEWVVDPAGDHYYYWLGLISVAFIYNAVMVIPRAVFNELDGHWAFLMLDYMCDLLYIIDIPVNMFSGYLEEGVMVHEPRKLVREYLATKSSKLDILSVIPTDLAFPFTGLGAPYPFLRINRVLKFTRFDRFFKRLESRTSHPDFFRMVYTFFTFVVIIHWDACLYYYISEEVGLNSDGWIYPGEADWRLDASLGLTNENDTLHQKYIWSFYWSLQTLTLIAQIKQPEFDGEFAFVTLNFLIGVLIFANIVGNVTRIIGNMNLVSDNFRQKTTAVKQYCILRKIEGDLQQRIIRYFEYQWMNQQFVDETKSLACLPDKLEAELALRVHLDTLKRVNIFQDVEPGLLADLVLKLKLEIYSPGDYICRKGDIGKEMYIVKRGQLEVVGDDGETVFATLGQGSVFGEISILNIIGIKSGNRRTANVRSVGYSDLFCLLKHDLWDALREYPEAKKKMLERGKNMLIKDQLLDEKAADENDVRQANFLDKVERVEKNIDDMQTRFARLIAEEGATLSKMRMRVHRLQTLLQIQLQHYR
ncbi:Cyclic nucleotide-gated cation channel alpha-3 [Hypsibius exemplaris]|uniref:Cyclic nucleotide-gated cation channel alpha-3 n=1 Tax=Hypsibius exemplaris TaxID=2072580 RepID=A0A1W0WW38_HYPEX|nr:Cyclic nucleotide-gated cation channel alpha-3 [Hypsibius exemplaris]